MQEEESLARKIYLAKKEWCLLDKEASILELKRKSIISQWILEVKAQDYKKPLSLIEHEVRASTEYMHYIDNMIHARTQANLKMAEVDGIKERIREIERENIKNAMEIKYNNSNGFGG